MTIPSNEQNETKWTIEGQREIFESLKHFHDLAHDERLKDTHDTMIHRYLQSEAFLKGVQAERERAKELVEALEKIKDRKPDDPQSVEAALEGSNVDDAFNAGMDSECSQVAFIASEALAAYKASEGNGNRRATQACVQNQRSDAEDKK